MSEVQLYDNELSNMLKDLRQQLGIASQLPLQARVDKFAQCDGIVSRIKTIKESYILEMNELYGEPERVYKMKLEDHMKEFEALENELRWKKSEVQKEQLLARKKGKDAGAGTAPLPENPSEMTATQLIELGHTTQNNAAASLARTRQMLEESIQVGTETAKKIDEQGDQISRVYDDMREMEDVLKRADKLIRGFLRRAATDKIIMSLICLIVSCIIFIIVWKSLGYDTAGNFNAPDILPNKK